MRTTLTGLALLLAAGAAWAQVGNLTGADVADRTAVSDPAEIARQLDDSWLAFTMPVLDGTASPCCWQGNWNEFGTQGCSLESRPTGFGSRGDAPDTDLLVVFAKVEHGDVRSMRVVGEQCPVEGQGARVEWLGEVGNEEGLDWLETVARSGDSDSVRHSALYALAQHRDEAVTGRLSAMARNGGPELQHQSIFWLGEARGAAGLAQLEQLLGELPPGESRRELNFAIAQAGTPAAMELLIRISRTDADREQRSGALFWLAHDFPAEAEPLLLNLLTDETDSEILERAVFALSQLPEDRSGPVLLALARDSQAPREVRRQALFWLAQSDDDETIAQLTELLTR